MGKLLEQRNRALDDINAGRTVKKIRDLESRVRELETQLAANNPLLDEAANRIDELEEENARLKAECDDIKQVQFPRKLEAVAVGWKKQLAATREELDQILNPKKEPTPCA